MGEEPDFIPLARPRLGEEEWRALREPLFSGWVTQGPQVAAFEAEFAAQVGAPHACAVSSCTAALHLALLAVGVEPGDEVVTASHSFIATANAVRSCGALPVFVDIRPETYNMDPARVAAALTPRTRAVLCVHQMGMPCDLAALAELAGERGIALVEDAACAAGSAIRLGGEWESIGRPRGAAACFSFHPRKVITTGDGGMVTTADPDLDRRLRLLRQHGMDVPDRKRHEARRVIFESYAVPGFNYRMTDIQAAVGRVQLQRLPGLVAERRRLAARYGELLGALPGVGPPEEPAWTRSNWQSYCLRLPAGCDQRRVMQAMLDEGVATRRGIMCAHLEPAYAADPAGWRAAGGLARSEEARDRCITLPLYPGMGEAEQERVRDALARACGG